jgi:hypothetical protein
VTHTLRLVPSVGIYAVVIVYIFQEMPTVVESETLTMDVNGGVLVQ